MKGNEIYYLAVIIVFVNTYVLHRLLKKKTEIIDRLLHLCETYDEALKPKKNVSEPIITRRYELRCHNCKFLNNFNVNNKGAVMGFSVKEKTL